MATYAKEARAFRKRFLTSQGCSILGRFLHGAACRPYHMLQNGKLFRRNAIQIALSLLMLDPRRVMFMFMAMILEAGMSLTGVCFAISVTQPYERH